MIPKRPGETAGALGRRTREPRSALRVLRRLASPLQAVLLALLGPRIPRQQAGLAEGGAIRHGIARALLSAHPDARAALREAGLLTRDPRAKERKKYGLKRARKAPQYTKR